MQRGAFVCRLQQAQGPTWWCDALADVVLTGRRAPVVVRPAWQVEVMEAAAPAAAAVVELATCPVLYQGQVNACMLLLQNSVAVYC
jgi:hypothetical protein